MPYYSKKNHVLAEDKEMKQCNNCGELRNHLDKNGVCLLCKNESGRGKIVKATTADNTKVFKGNLGSNLI